MLPLELVGPGGSRSTVLYSNPAMLVRCQSEGVLAGRNSNGGKQLRPDNGSVRPSAGGEAGGGNGRTAQPSKALDSKLCDIHESHLYSAFFVPISLIFGLLIDVHSNWPVKIRSIFALVFP
jgi:hypothetical protein